MVLETQSCTAWAEPRLVLSPSDTFKAARLGGIAFDPFHMTELWLLAVDDPTLRLHLEDSAAHGIHQLLTLYEFEALFNTPSPFITDDSF